MKLNKDFNLIIQTHSEMVGTSFAMTTVISSKTNESVPFSLINYESFKKFATPDDLFDQISSIYEIIKKGVNDNINNNEVKEYHDWYNGETWALRIITDYLHDFRIQFSIYNSRLIPIYTCNHGILVKLTKGIFISIQTHTVVVREGFAETNILNTDKIFYQLTEFGYDSSIGKLHLTPEDLIEHLIILFDSFHNYEKAYEIESKVVEDEYIPEL